MGVPKGLAVWREAIRVKVEWRQLSPVGGRGREWGPADRRPSASEL